MTQTGEAAPQAPPDKSAAKQHPDPRHAFEPDDVPVRGALWAVAGLLFGAVISALLVWELFRYFADREGAAPLPSIETQRLEPPLPKLETTLLGDSPLIRGRAAIDSERYRWLDATHTRAQVPVSRAMSIVAAQGWPDREDAR